MGASTGCGSQEQATTPTQPATTTASATTTESAVGSRTLIDTEEFGTCLVTDEPWDLDPELRVGFCVASPSEYAESYVSCVTFTDDLTVAPDDVEFHGNDGRLESTNIDRWETEGCELALPAARDWLAAEIKKG